jgi:hypothetical protein
MVDVEGAQAFRDIQAEIDTLNVERLGKAKERDERRLVVEEAERTMKRHQGALKRIQIEWRNIEARAAKTAGADIPNELDAKLDALDEQQIHAKANLDSAIKQFKELLAEFLPCPERHASAADYCSVGARARALVR